MKKNRILTERKIDYSIVNIKKNRVISEKRIESSVTKKAIELGYLTYKVTSPSNRGIPDRIFINKNGDIFFIEFKSLSGKLSTLQKMMFSKFLARRVPVYLVNNIQRGVNILKNNIDIISDTTVFDSNDIRVKIVLPTNSSISYVPEITK